MLYFWRDWKGNLKLIGCCERKPQIEIFFVSREDSEIPLSHGLLRHKDYEWRDFFYLPAAMAIFALGALSIVVAVVHSRSKSDLAFRAKRMQHRAHVARCCTNMLHPFGQGFTPLADSARFRKHSRDVKYTKDYLGTICDKELLFWDDNGAWHATGMRRHYWPEVSSGQLSNYVNCCCFIASSKSVTLLSPFFHSRHAAFDRTKSTDPTCSIFPCRLWTSQGVVGKYLSVSSSPVHQFPRRRDWQIWKSRDNCANQKVRCCYRMAWSWAFSFGVLFILHAIASDLGSFTTSTSTCVPLPSFDQPDKHLNLLGFAFLFDF